MEFKEFMEARGSSGKNSAMSELVDAIKSVFKRYNLDVRRIVWDKLTSTKGKKEMDRLVRSPNASVSISDFIKLMGEKSITSLTSGEAC